MRRGKEVCVSVRRRKERVRKCSEEERESVSVGGGNGKCDVWEEGRKRV